MENLFSRLFSPFQQRLENNKKYFYTSMVFSFHLFTPLCGKSKRKMLKIQIPIFCFALKTHKNQKAKICGKNSNNFCL